jgi:hypothetical protein
MSWWDCGQGDTDGGVLELDGLDLELEVRFSRSGRVVAWWVSSQSGEWLRRAWVGIA